MIVTGKNQERLVVNEGEIVVCVYSSDRGLYMKGECFQMRNGWLVALEPRNYKPEEQFAGICGHWEKFVVKDQSIEDLL
jgi:hypothetical protein